MSDGRYRVGIDIGGTFTDYVLVDSATGEAHLHKRLTTPEDPAEGALVGLGALLDKHDLTLADLDAIVHGTTLVTNAVIERRGARTALLTTSGFRDVLEMGHEQRYDIYDLFLQFPEPLVPRRLRLEVNERMSRDGEPLKTPDLETVRRQMTGLVEQGVEAVAISFLHSYRNPEHERRVAALIREEFPHLFVSISSEVIPEIREYERTVTTVCNAYVQPLIDRYLHRLEAHLAEGGFAGRFLLMQSSGGSATPETARRFPVRLLESGPAGGAQVSAFLGKALRLPDLLSFDMGGTTAKACLIQDSRPATSPVMEAGRVHRFKRGSGMPIKTPVVDLIEIGAGGGSIAHADNLGLLKVGPRSAGADPGPACYGRGGTEPTVTDACLTLGYFDPSYFLGGGMELDPVAAWKALESLGKRLDLTVEQTAWGIYQVVCENMAAAARVYIIEKGQDPRRHALMAFGGAGPAHAARVAGILRAPEVIVPPVSGVASALGFLVAPIAFEFSRSAPTRLKDLDWNEAARLFAEMEEEGQRILAEAGVDPANVRLERRAEMRLAGQFHDIEVPVPGGRLCEDTGAELTEVFAREYQRLYHSVLPEYEPMVMNWRLRAAGPEPDIRLGDRDGLDPLDFTGAPSGEVDAEVAKKGSRDAYFPETGGHILVPVYDRYSLRHGMRLEGPAIVEERESTTIVGPGDILTVDRLANLRIAVVSHG